MNERKFQMTMRLPKSKGGRYIVTYKVAIRGQLRTVLGSGPTAQAAKDQVERQIRALTGGDHEVLKVLAAQGLDSSNDPVPF